MSDATLSHDATMLLKQLRTMPSVDAFDRGAAQELVERGLAVHIPATGAIEATEAGRTDGFAAPVPDNPAPLAADAMTGIGDPRRGEGNDAAFLRSTGTGTMGTGLGVNGTAGSQGLSKSLKSDFAPPAH